MMKQEQSECDVDWRDDRFFFIAGYTSGGAPYGVTWEEMGLEPYENEFDDDDAVCFRHYEHLPKWEKDSVDGKLRDSFSAYVKRRRRLPSRQARDAMIAQVFDSAPGGPILHTKEFNAIYRKLVRKRENAFIREGVLPKRFSPTEIQRYLNQTVMLESDRLLFRKISAEDFEDLADMLRDPEAMAAWEHTFSDEEIQKWIDTQLTRYRDHIVGYFAVIHKESGAFVGQAGLMWSDIEEVRALEVGYMLKRRYWHNGYAAESTDVLIQYAFGEIGVNKVYATIRPENEASLKVARQAGMTAEGSYIKQYNGAEMEHMILSISRTPEQGK